MGNAPITPPGDGQGTFNYLNGPNQPGPPPQMPGGLSQAAPPPPGIPGPSHMAPGPGAPPPPPGPGAGGGYEFRPEEFQPVIDEVWALVHGALREAQNHARDLVGIDAPGREVVSEGFVQTANTHGQSYNEWLKSTIEGLMAYATSLEGVRDKLQTAEDNAGQAIKGTDF